MFPPVPDLTKLRVGSAALMGGPPAIGVTRLSIQLVPDVLHTSDGVSYVPVDDLL